MIALLDHFVKRVDRTARARRRSRSELIREALR
jgi:metal-responsive CopG/Arc/MetJ family transcriptional regulator